MERTIGAMRISEVASRAGVPATTLRYYESIGLLTPSRENNLYRTFDEPSLERLAFINAAKELGLELFEIKELLELVDSGTCTKVKEALHPLLTEQLDRVEESLANLNRLHDHLIVASTHVIGCPDSSEKCRSECAFLALSQSKKHDGEDKCGLEQRRSHWQRILEQSSVTVQTNSVMIELPAELVIEAVSLSRLEHTSDPSTTFVIELNDESYTLTVSSEMALPTMWEALIGDQDTPGRRKTGDKSAMVL